MATIGRTQFMHLLAWVTNVVHGQGVKVLTPSQAKAEAEFERARRAAYYADDDPAYERMWGTM